MALQVRHPSRKQPYPNLPQNVNHYPREFIVMTKFLPQNYPYISPMHRNPQKSRIHYSEFVGSGQPPPTLGVHGDLYMDETPSSPALYSRGATEWLVWLGPQFENSRSIRTVHPAFGGYRLESWRFAYWCHGPRWYSYESTRTMEKALSAAGHLDPTTDRRKLASDMMKNRFVIPKQIRKPRESIEAECASPEPTSDDDDDDTDANVASVSLGKRRRSSRQPVPFRPSFSRVTSSELSSEDEDEDEIAALEQEGVDLTAKIQKAEEGLSRLRRTPIPRALLFIEVAFDNYCRSTRSVVDKQDAENRQTLTEIQQQCAEKRKDIAQVSSEQNEIKSELDKIKLFNA